MRRTRYNIPKQFWRFPHCGFEHGAADLLRSDWDKFRCKSCGKDFPAGPAKSASAALRMTLSDASWCPILVRRCRGQGGTNSHPDPNYRIGLLPKHFRGEALEFGPALPGILRQPGLQACLLQERFPVPSPLDSHLRK
jgi:hypothetical protein